MSKIDPNPCAFCGQRAGGGSGEHIVRSVRDELWPAPGDSGNYPLNALLAVCGSGTPKDCNGWLNARYELPGQRGAKALFRGEPIAHAPPTCAWVAKTLLLLHHPLAYDSTHNKAKPSPEALAADQDPRVIAERARKPYRGEPSSEFWTPPEYAIRIDEGGHPSKLAHDGWPRLEIGSDDMASWRATGEIPGPLRIWLVRVSPTAFDKPTQGIPIDETERPHLVPPVRFHDPTQRQSLTARLVALRRSPEANSQPTEPFIAFHLVWRPGCDFDHPFEQAGLAVRIWPDPPGHLDPSQLEVLGRADVANLALCLTVPATPVGIPTPAGLPRMSELPSAYLRLLLDVADDLR